MIKYVITMILGAMLTSAALAETWYVYHPQGGVSTIQQGGPSDTIYVYGPDGVTTILPGP
jgi:hypothetical protein